MKKATQSDASNRVETTSFRQGIQDDQKAQIVLAKANCQKIG